MYNYLNYFDAVTVEEQEKRSATHMPNLLLTCKTCGEHQVVTKTYAETGRPICDHKQRQLVKVKQVYLTREQLKGPGAQNALRKAVTLKPKNYPPQRPYRQPPLTLTLEAARQLDRDDPVWLHQKTNGNGKAGIKAAFNQLKRIPAGEGCVHVFGRPAD